MAPVGSRESLMAAIQAGADAVYFGVQGLNMRSRSSANFTLDDLREIADICRQHAMKSYLTLNTVMYDNDLDRMREIVNAVKEAGVTAVIASDMAAILYARSQDVEVHISTQVNITNIEAVRWYAQWADVMVLARELNLDQVRAIHQAIIKEEIRGPHGDLVRLEMFCHGALCMAVSGKCYMSLHEMNSSANRGACNQICRRSYILTDKETGEELAVENQYIMSPKDLKTIHFINKMADAGISVFKIEGRARGPEYVRETVECYDEALRAFCSGEFATVNTDIEQKINTWDLRLSRVFNRGFWDGYYLGQRLGEWSYKYGSSATRVKRYAATALRYYPKLGVGEFRLDIEALHTGDEVVVTGPNTGALIFTVKELRLDRDPLTEVAKGDVFSTPVPEKIRPGDRLYLWMHTKAAGDNTPPESLLSNEK